MPNTLSAGAMMFGSQMLGRGEWSSLCRLIRDCRLFAFTCAIVFTAAVAAVRDVSPSAFANDVDEAEFAPIAERAYSLAIALTPFRALVGVYGPLLVATQHYRTWGALVGTLFFVVYLPITVGAAHTQSVELLIAANLAYDVAHFVLLYAHVHYRCVREYERKAAAAPGGAERGEASGTAGGEGGGPGGANGVALEEAGGRTRGQT